MGRIPALALFFATTYVAVAATTLTARQAAAPAGKTAWEGIFTAPQADRGRLFFSGNCAECHGENLQGGEGAPLTGERFWNDWGQRPVDELLSYISTNMPFSEDGSLRGTLPPSTYVDIVTHILRTNGFPPGSQEMTAQSATGVQIVPKDGGSSELPASTLAHVVGCLGPRRPDGSWPLTMASAPTRLAVGAKPSGDTALGQREFALKFVLRNLTTMVGHKLSVTGLLLGAGGSDGINVNTVDSVAPACN